jgi:hypothetical protein
MLQELFIKVDLCVPPCATANLLDPRTGAREQFIRDRNSSGVGETGQRLQGWARFVIFVIHGTRKRAVRHPSAIDPIADLPAAFFHDLPQPRLDWFPKLVHLLASMLLYRSMNLFLK